jgi:Fe-S-cluster containining protein
VVTDLDEVRRLAAVKSGENLAFRRYLKAHHVSDEPFHIIAEDVQKHIDCTQCANCCRNTIVAVSEREIALIAEHLHLTPDQVAKQYTAPDPEQSGRRVLSSRGDECVFLDGNLCMIYDARPQACRDFPYAVLRKRSLGGRMESLCRKSSMCPIVFNALEAYKHVAGFH